MEQTIGKACWTCAELDSSKPFWNGTSCISCEEAGMHVDISGRRCVSECGKSQKLSGNTCECEKHYKVSDDGFRCKSTALETSTVTAIVIGCIAVAVLAAFLTYTLACTKDRSAPKKQEDDNTVLRISDPVVLQPAK